MKFLIFLSITMKLSAFVVPNNSPPGDSNLPINQLQFESEIDRLEFQIDFIKELDEAKKGPEEQYVLISASEFSVAVNALFEVEETNEKMMNVIELMEIAAKIRTVQFEYFLICFFLGGILVGWIFMALFIFLELKIGSCDGNMIVCLFLTVLALFSYYVVIHPYFHDELSFLNQL